MNHGSDVFWRFHGGGPYIEVHEALSVCMDEKS